MKKALLVFLCIFALLLGGCANRQNTPLGRGLELIDDMKVLIDSDDMQKIYKFYNEEYDAEIEKLRSADFSKPEAVYKVTFDEIELLDAINGAEISDEVYDIFEARAATAIASTVNSKGGVTGVTLAAVYNVGSVFECKAVEENMVYFYVYDGALIAVSFTDGEDDACQASASLVINENFDVSSAESLNESLELLISCDFDVEKVY